MKSFPIPVREAPVEASGVPAGSRHDDEAPQYPEMPQGMTTFSMPSVPEYANATTLAQARGVLQGFLEALQSWSFATRASGPRCDLIGLPEDVLRVLNDVLGEGEVSARLDPEKTGRDVRIQETVFTGVWRVREFNAEGVETAYWLEAGSLPAVALEGAHATALPALPEVEMPAQAMNAPALFTEIRAKLAAFDADAAAHVINLTLLPLTPGDHQVLTEALPVGPLAVISRSFGSCRVTSTGVRHLWRVQHFNSKNTLILNTLEIVERPHSVLAAAEDINDTRERLDELIDWMVSSLETV